MIEAQYAPLSAALIRRSRAWPTEQPIRITLSPAVVEDIRLFALTWAAGFAFFLALLV
jgi:hypothetical protein